jgi:hypothetical protein
MKEYSQGSTMVYSNDSYHVLVPSSYLVKSQILVGWRLENKTKMNFIVNGKARALLKS